MAATATATYIKSFAIEIATQRNSDVVLQCIPGLRLRGAIDPGNGVVDPETGDEIVSQDQAADMGGFPKTPGLHVHVNPEKGTYSIVDPLRGDEELCARIKKFMERKRGFKTADRLDGRPTQKGKLDRHIMKSLCREMVQIVEAGHGKFVMGPEPSIEEIDEMPGKYLLQPGLRTQTMMPRYEEDWDNYVNNLRSSGG